MRCDLMAEAISAHRSGNLSKRAKRQLDKRFNELFKEAMQEIRDRHPALPPDPIALLQKQIKQDREFLTMCGRRQRKQIQKRIDDVELAIVELKQSQGDTEQ